MLEIRKDQIMIYLFQLDLQETCHTAPPEIQCDDEIPVVREKLKNKIKHSQSRNNGRLQPVYTPGSSVRTCDPCPPVPREAVSTASDTLNCRYEDDGKDDEKYEGSASQTVEVYDNINSGHRPKRKVQFETKCREFTPSCGGTDSVNFQVLHRKRPSYILAL